MRFIWRGYTYILTYIYAVFWCLYTYLYIFIYIYTYLYTENWCIYYIWIYLYIHIIIRHYNSVWPCKRLSSDSELSTQFLLTVLHMTLNSSCLPMLQNSALQQQGKAWSNGWELWRDSCDHNRKPSLLTISRPIWQRSTLMHVSRQVGHVSQSQSWIFRVFLNMEG